MTIHVMVIGQRSATTSRPHDGLLNLIARRVNAKIAKDASETEETTFFARLCTQPQALVQIVRQIAVDHGKIDTLDLYDHGSLGRILMGEGTLFDHEDGSFPLAAELRPLLAEHARVRLLGCDIAWGPDGQKLLLRLREAFDPCGSVIVYGSVALIDVSEFTPMGFARQFVEEQYLVSSTEVKLEVAGDFDQRAAKREQWAREQRAKLPGNTPNPNSEI